MDPIHEDDGDVLEIITRRWNLDIASDPGDPSGVTLSQRVFLNGREVKNAMRTRVIANSGDFNTVMLRLAPGRLIVRDVDNAEWQNYDGALGRREEV